MMLECILKNFTEQWQSREGRTLPELLKNGAALTRVCTVYMISGNKSLKFAEKHQKLEMAWIYYEQETVIKKSRIYKMC